MAVVSFAGAEPPLSCLNDGLQVGTGATLGHGTISISNDPATRPSASFTHDGRTAVLTLKKTYWDAISAKIKQGVEKQGALTHEYFDYIRRLAISYWLDLDRREIFEVEWK